MNRLSNRIRFYIALPDLVVVIVALALFWRPFINVLLGGASWITAQVSWPDWSGALVFDVLADLIAAAIIVAAAIVLIWVRRRHALAGRFRAYDTTSGQSQEWGKVTLLHQLAATSLAGARMRLELYHDDIVLHGEGVIVQEQHFVGFYREVSHPARRRCGAFFMTLNGEANAYEGQFVYLDPKTNQPSLGRARWDRV